MLQTNRKQISDSELPSTTFRLTNGIRLTHVKTNDARFYLGITFQCGSRHESPEKSGISHFLEHMMFRGSRSYPSFLELAEAFDWLGGEWNAATGHEHTEYWYSGLSRSANQVIPLFYEFLQYPLHLDLESEREVILREREDELNEQGLYIDPSYHHYCITWPNSSLAQAIIGEEDTIRSFSLADLKSHREEYYQPGNMAICLVGNLDPDIVEMAIQLFSQYDVGRDQALPKSYTLPAAAKGPQICCVENSDNQYRIQLSFRSEGDRSPQATNYNLIARVLADGFCGRLSKKLREELGLVYDVSADAILMEDTGSLDIVAAVSVDRFSEYLENLCEILVNLAQNGPSSRDLERAASRALTDLDLLPSMPESIGSRWGWRSLTGRDPSLAEDRNFIKTATTNSVARTCRDLFQISMVGLVIIGPGSADLESVAHEILRRKMG